MKHSKDLAAFAPHGIDEELKRLHYETANSVYAPTMAALLKYIPISQIMFGSDFPYVGVDDNVGRLQKIGLDFFQLNAIERDNALKLFARLKRRF
jgi:predicted TIM-barrel fold metal-dependent hydrolase